MILLVNKDYFYFILGHGKSYKGGSCLINDFKEEIIDVSWKFVEIHYNLNREQFSKIPIFLWGESLGGATVIAMIMNPSKEVKIAGIIGSGPMVTITDKPNGFLTGVISLFSKCCNFGLGVEDQSKNSSLLSQQKLYNSHLECFKKSLPAKTAIQLFKMSDYVVEHLNNSGIDIPMLIQYGKDDTTCSGYDLLINKNVNKDKKIIKYDGRHCITHDITILSVVDDLAEWLLERSQEKKTTNDNTYR